MRHWSIVCLALYFCCSSVAVAQNAGSVHLQRVVKIKTMLGDIEDKSTDEILRELKKSPYPSTLLVMREAMAKTYLELVQGQGVRSYSKRQWLYSMINLNMAYLQFAGIQHKQKSDSTLNMLIRQTLKKHLPSDIDRLPGFLQSVD